MDIDIDMANSIRNQHTEDIAVNLVQHWKKESQAAEERTKARFKQKEKWFKENWNLQQIYNNIMIWNQVQENLTKFREIFLSCTKEKVRKKLIETLDLCQKNSM